MTKIKTELEQLRDRTFELNNDIRYQARNKFFKVKEEIEMVWHEVMNSTSMETISQNMLYDIKLENYKISIIHAPHSSEKTLQFYRLEGQTPERTIYVIPSENRCIYSSIPDSRFYQSTHKEQLEILKDEIEFLETSRKIQKKLDDEVKNEINKLVKQTKNIIKEQEDLLEELNNLKI